MVASLLGGRDNPAELALKTVDDCRKALGIYEIRVGVALEIASRILERVEFD